MMNIELDNDYEKMAAIKVLGVGGGGGNAVNRMIQSGMSSVEFISVNTDNQSLRFSNASYKLHIGDKLTRGQGAGGDPVKGEKAAEESEDEITSVLRGADMVYITAGIEPTPSGRKQCVVRFFGQAMPDNATYKLESTIVEKLEIPEDIIKKDKDAKYVTYEDQKHKVSSGSEGYVVKTYLQYCKNGVVQSQTLISTDTYRARAAVYYVGVAPR